MSGLDFQSFDPRALLAQIEWLSPWVLLALPLPLLFHRLPAYRQRRPALRIAFFDLAVQGSGRSAGPGAVVVPAGIAQMGVLTLAWCLLLLALARPVLVEPPLTRIQPARDLLLAVDISPSMRARDYVDRQGQPASRMAAVREVLDEFIARRSGDRIGLLFFGQEPYVQAPFTLEHDTVRELLAQAEPGMAGGRTMIGDALGLCAAVGYAGYLLILRMLGKQVNVGAVMFWATFGAGLVALTLALLFHEPMLPQTLNGWLILVSLALVVQVGGQGLIAYGVGRLPIVASTVLLWMQPLVAAALSWMLFSEALGPMALMGAALVLAGIYVVQRSRA